MESERRYGSNLYTQREMHLFNEWIGDMEMILLLVVTSLGINGMGFNNCWFLHHGFEEVVLNSWCDSEGCGWSAFVVKEKLKRLKMKLKEWNRDLLVDWWSIARMKASLLVQKSRVRSLKKGDANTSFFHACIDSRRRRNHISGIWIERVWIEEENSLVEVVYNIFQKVLCTFSRSLPTIDGVKLNSLSFVQVMFLDVVFLEEDIKRLVWCCTREKSHEPCVGANPRNLNSWKNDNDSLTCRLASWKRKHISFRGKWKWRRMSDLELLWVKVVDSKYGSELMLSENRQVVVTKNGGWINDLGNWSITWKRPLLSRDEDSMGRLAIMDELQRRHIATRVGVERDNLLSKCWINCDFFGEQVKSVNHLLLGCAFASSVWRGSYASHVFYLSSSRDA
ncbi:hypothetical protein Lal_00018436 [Lupinus albus]|nr:hypothetical protein Lal_00018436 [Lupinus albus]